MCAFCPAPPSSLPCPTAPTNTVTQPECRHRTQSPNHAGRGLEGTPHTRGKISRAVHCLEACGVARRIVLRNKQCKTPSTALAPGVTVKVPSFNCKGQGAADCMELSNVGPGI